MRRLGDLEAEIMDRLWTWNRPATVREGRAWLYSPVRSREAYAAALMEDGLRASRDLSAALVHHSLPRHC